MILSAVFGRLIFIMEVVIFAVWIYLHVLYIWYTVQSHECTEKYCRPTPAVYTFEIRMYLNS